MGLGDVPVGLLPVGVLAIVFAVYLIFKCVDFILVAANLYRRMAYQQDAIITLLLDIRDHITLLLDIRDHTSRFDANEMGKWESVTPRVKHH